MSSISIEMIRKSHDPETGYVTLTFNLAFHPTIGDITETIILSVASATGATWRFPVKLAVAEPPADDVIRINGCEIGSSSVVSFQLFGQTGDVQFTAGFLQGSDAEFELTPTSGTLLESGTNFTVTYRPRIYGRQPKARLVISTSEKTVIISYKLLDV